jgi:hypothetical protein
MLPESARPDSPEYKATAGRGIVLGVVRGALTLGIIILMALKPPLWG